MKTTPVVNEVVIDQVVSRLRAGIVLLNQQRHGQEA